MEPPEVYSRRVWLSVSQPARVDTLRMRLRAVRCGLVSTIYAERDGQWLAISVEGVRSTVRYMNRITRPGEDWVYLVLPDGTLDVAVWSEDDAASVYRLEPRHQVRAATRIAAANRLARRRRDALSQGWSAATADLVAAGQIVVGMTPAMVRMSWGAPEHVNATTTGGGSREQWVYGSGYYVYLEGGRVTSIQTRE
jgi:hypothetical protein